MALNQKIISNYSENKTSPEFLLFGQRLSFAFHYFSVQYISFQVASEAVACRCSKKWLLCKLWETSQEEMFGAILFLILFLACLNSDSIEHLQTAIKKTKILDIKIFIYKDIQYYFFCMEIFVSTWNYNTNRNNI